MAETIWPSKQKVFTNQSLPEKFAEPCFSVKGGNPVPKWETEAQRVEVSFSRPHISEGFLTAQITQTIPQILCVSVGFFARNTEIGPTNEYLHKLKVI